MCLPYSPPPPLPVAATGTSRGFLGRLLTMARERFSGALPTDRLYDRQYDMWLQEAADGRVTIGATAFGLHLAGEVIAFTPKPRGAQIDAGRGLGTIETGKTVLAVHCPVALLLEAANESAEENPALIERDPYGAGWMVRGLPRAWATDRQRLVDAASYRAHCLRIEPDADITVEAP
jgi:glycine cleavage system H protein